MEKTFKEVQSTMTRDEFNAMLREYDGSIKLGSDIVACPDDVGLTDLEYCSGSCEHCWLEAIKQIKFKGEDTPRYTVKIATKHFYKERKSNKCDYLIEDGIITISLDSTQIIFKVNDLEYIEIKEEA